MDRKRKIEFYREVWARFTMGRIHGKLIEEAKLEIKRDFDELCAELDNPWLDTLDRIKIIAEEVN